MAKLIINDKTYQKSIEKINEINNAKFDLSFDARDINVQIFLDEFFEEEKRILNIPVKDLALEDEDIIKKLRKKCATFKGTPQWNKFEMGSLFKRLDARLEKENKYFMKKAEENDKKKQKLAKIFKILAILAAISYGAIVLFVGSLSGKLNESTFSFGGFVSYIPVLLALGVSIFAFVKNIIHREYEIYITSRRYWCTLINVMCTAFLTALCFVLKGDAVLSSTYHLAFTPYAILFWANLISFSLSIILIYCCVFDLVSKLPSFFQLALSIILALPILGIWLVFMNIIKGVPVWFYMPYYLCIFMTILFAFALFLSSMLCSEYLDVDDDHIGITITIAIMVGIVSIVCGCLHRTYVRQVDNVTMVATYRSFTNVTDINTIYVNDEQIVTIGEGFGDVVKLTSASVENLKGKVTKIIITNKVQIVDAHTFDDFNDVEICVYFSSWNLPEQWNESWTNSSNITYNYST